MIPIDEHDNGVKQNPLSNAFKVFNPCWDDDTSENVAFHRAMNVAQMILKQHIDTANSTSRAKDHVRSQYTGGEILVLDRSLPWTDAVHDDPLYKDVLFVVYPSDRGGWNVQTVTKAAGSYANRMNFPAEWLGHEDPERGIRFAHTSNFLIACNTKEQAIKVAEEAIEEGSKYAEVVCSI